jgi:hypothetical protein
LKILKDLQYLNLLKPLEICMLVFLYFMKSK